MRTGIDAHNFTLKDSDGSDRTLRDHRVRTIVLHAEIQKGIDSLEAGRYRDGAEAMAEIRERLLTRKLSSTE